MKTWQLVTLITLSVVATALVTASALVLLNQPKPNALGTYINYPNTAIPSNANPYSSPGLQTVIPTPTPNAPIYAPPIAPQAGPQQPTNLTTPANPSTTTTLTINNAAAIAQNYVIRLNNPDLAVGRIEEYSQNFYVPVYERSTGAGAFELIIDRYTGAAYPETGPSTIWNTKYGTGTNSYRAPYSSGPGPGMMWGELGGWFGGTTNTNTAMAVTPYQAQSYAQQYLNTYYPRTTTGLITAFYGYYTIEVLSGANTYGLISVNGYTGQVWYHNWHGSFIQ